jgi:S-(hydroxymethyl)glutathione dehydrogenase/alcohol dehydrogenase
MAGARVIAAIDPVALKRDAAKDFGATHTYASMQEAMEKLDESTWGRGFDKVIMTMGVGDADSVGQAFNLGGKRAKIVITNLHPSTEANISVPGLMLTLFEKQIIGSLFGSANIRKDIPRLFELYLQGQLNLDDLITKTYTLDQINEGYDAMRNGENIRGVILFD